MKKIKRLDADLIAQIAERAREMPCPKCGVVGLAIRERYDPTRSVPINAQLSYGPRGMPLWAWCDACGAHGRVGEVTDGGFPA